MKAIYYVGGGKGGVGKSTVSIALLDYLTGKGEKTFLVETDTSNPDVFKIYGKQVESTLVNLDEADGWIILLNELEKNKESTVVINSAARSATGIARYGKTLADAALELNRQLIALWVINRQRDSLELLKDFLEHIKGAKTHVLRNLYYGDENKFSLYADSKIRKEVEALGGLSLNFPDVADRVSEEIISKRISISEAIKTMPLGNRAELIRWKNEAAKIFDLIAKA